VVTPEPGAVQSGRHDPAGQVIHEGFGIRPVPLADQERRDELGSLVQGDEKVLVPDPVVLAFGVRELVLLLETESPNLIALKVPEMKVPHPGIEELAELLPGPVHQLHYGGPVNAS
jgi:hypothetical protein